MMASLSCCNARSSLWWPANSIAVTEDNSLSIAMVHGPLLSSVNLEFILQALRRSQAYFAVMAQMKPKRTYEDIVFEIKAIQQVGLEDVLLQWQLQDILPRKAEVKAREWLYGLSELCRHLRHQFDEHSRTGNVPQTDSGLRV